MACRLCAVKSLSEPMLEYCQLNLWEKISVKFESKYNNFHSRKCISKCCLQNGGHLVSISQSVILMYVIWRPEPHLNELSNYDIMELATCFIIVSSIIDANYICLWNNKSLMNKQLFLTNTIYLSWFATAGWVCESRFGNYQLFEFDGNFCKFYAYITCRFISTMLSVPKYTQRMRARGRQLSVFLLRNHKEKIYYLCLIIHPNLCWWTILRVFQCHHNKFLFIVLYDYVHFIWFQWRHMSVIVSHSEATRMFAQQSLQTEYRQNIKAPHYCPFMSESTEGYPPVAGGFAS